ncbi:CHASE2 domain-containing protein [Desulfosarcina sp.]|uniref:CHASE2 domain-containing serine/threonine-protein kinase n=1 Tax=Desulfosarcina sp. TaxID=2027861 RepID=UPI0035661E2B
MLKKILTSPFIQILLLTGVVLACMVSPLDPWAYFENRNYDYWVGRVHHTQEQPIAIVAIDERSIRQFGDWPWPRSRIADLVRLISDHGAETLGVCILYTQPDQNPGLLEIRQLKAQLGDAQRKGAGSSTDRFDGLLSHAESRLNQDDRLIAAIRRGRNVVLPIHGAMQHQTGNDIADPSGMVIINSLSATVLPTGGTGTPLALIRSLGTGSQGPPAVFGLFEPFEALAGKAGAMGHTNLQADPDGRVRHLPLFVDYYGRLIPALPFQLALKHVGGRLKDLSVEADFFGQPHLLISHLDLPTDGAYRMLVNHDRRWTRQRWFSCSEIFNGDVDPVVFKDQIVLIGVTAETAAPTFPVGLRDRASAVEIMANALSGILASHRLSRPSWAKALEFGVVLYFAFFLVVVIPRVSPRVGAIILMSFMVTWYAATVGMLLGYGYRIEVLGPMVLAAGGFLVLQTTLASRRLQADKLDACKTLGLSYQGQGMFDMAYEQFVQCPVQDRTVKNLLYNLALDFERKRMFNKALDIYRHLRTAGAFKDVDKRSRRLSELDRTIVAGVRGDVPLRMGDGSAKPTFGRYEILRELGRGAMGAVYLARDPKINRNVAIKTLAYAEVEPAELVDVKMRFSREAEAAGKLSHPTIVSIYDVGEEHDMAYIAMELLSGETLTRYCQKDNLLPISRVLAVIADVSAALDYAHNQGVVHRDIKPANIMLLADGRVKVTDFSIAQVVDASQTRTGVILGTPNYMSPEQVNGKRIDGRSDLFSLGIVFYELLTGTRPFKGDSMSTILYAISHHAHTPLARVASDIPACVKSIVNRLLAKRTTKRFASAEKVVEEINACLRRLK